MTDNVPAKTREFFESQMAGAISVADKLLRLDALDVAAYKHNDIELKRMIAAYRDEVMQRKR